VILDKFENVAQVAHKIGVFRVRVKTRRSVELLETTEVALRRVVEIVLRRLKATGAFHAKPRGA
jgi:hypothetical protein